MAALTPMRMLRRRISWTVGVPLLVAICNVGIAQAGLFRCQRADGSVVYTDSQATCPGASEHSTTGSVQNTTNSENPPAASAAGRTPNYRPSSHSSISDTAAAEAAWRTKLEQTRHELSVVSDRHDSLARYATHCNRGGELFRTLPNGLKESVSCDGLRSEITSLASRRDTLREYLEHGIHDACRKSGCLPGWIR